jgi:mRNA interferase YafQ
LSYRLVATSQFSRALAKFRRAHPDLSRRVARILRDLESDPFQPSLRLHALRGRLEAQHAISVTHSYRVTLMLDTTEKVATLIDIGDHDDVYR